jgi:uncharacterized membrane protein (UPF0127 family)
MTQLVNKSQNIIIAKEAKSASTFIERAVGLLGKKSICDQEALFFPDCKSIHTILMRFNIDVIFVDKKIL